MIVCLCEAVNDRAIQREIHRGCTTVRDLQDRCGVGRQCGSCCPDLRRMLESATSEHEPRQGVGPAGLLRR